MYLTKFPLNVTRRETKRMLGSPYKLHAAIAGCFPQATSADADGRILWRVDRNPKGSVDLYIVSPCRPSLIGLDEQIGWPDLDPQWKTGDYDKFLDSLAVGQRFQFRLVANPVVSRKGIVNNEGRSKRMPHVTSLQISSWLAGKEAFEEAGADVPDYLARQECSRAILNGFALGHEEVTGLLQLTVSDSREYVFSHGKGKVPIKLATARYDGVLEVRDVAKLRHALTHGIGHGKGFGCGLMTLSPLAER